MDNKTLLFGGTAQGRLLSQALSEKGIAHYYSTKTPTAYAPSGSSTVLCGALSAVAMEEFCVSHGIKYIVDAAHPFAELLHAEMCDAARRSGLPVLRLERQYGERILHPLVHYCISFEDIMSEIEQSGARVVLAATGVNTIPKLKRIWQDTDRRVIFRVLDSQSSRQQALAHGLQQSDILSMHPPLSAAHELQLIRSLAAESVLSKETGHDGGLQFKISASIAAGIPIYIYCRPPIPDNFEVFDSIESIIAALTK